jgi:hypothetical protein
MLAEPTLHKNCPRLLTWALAITGEINDFRTKEDVMINAWMRRTSLGSLTQFFFFATIFSTSVPF